MEIRVKIREHIQAIERIKSEIRSLDRAGMHAYFAPEPAASESQLTALEHRIGFPIPDDFREFLLLADGWRAVVAGTDLFGTGRLAGDIAGDKWARFVFGEFEDCLGGVDLSQVHVIGCGLDADIFFMGVPGTSAEGCFFWRHNYGYEKDVGFSAFLGRIADAESEYLLALRKRLGAK